MFVVCIHRLFKDSCLLYTRANIHSNYLAASLLLTVELLKDAMYIRTFLRTFYIMAALDVLNFLRNLPIG